MEEPLVPYSPTIDRVADQTLPDYSLTFDDAWRRWNDAVEANALLVEKTNELNGTKSALEKAKEDVAVLDKKSSRLFKEMKGSPASRMLSKMHRRSKREVLAALRREQQTEFEEIHTNLSHARDEAEKLQTELQTTEAEVKRLNAKSDNLTRDFADLKWAFQVPNMADAVLSLADLEEELTQADNKEKVHRKTAAVFERARITVQHAHHYFKNCIETVDAIRGTGVGRALVGGMGEMSKNRDYQNSVELAARAQVCVNETFRILEPYQTELPEDIKAEHDALKELGLLQMSKIYGLMYGWRSARSDNVSRSTKLMLEKQERAYAHLTRFAVWVQDQPKKRQEEHNEAKKELLQVQQKLANEMHQIWCHSRRQ